VPKPGIPENPAGPSRPESPTGPTTSHRQEVLTVEEDRIPVGPGSVVDVAKAAAHLRQHGVVTGSQATFEMEPLAGEPLQDVQRDARLESREGPAS
jgi:hypothetical protein